MTERTKENLTLTPRLQAIADRVPQGARLADIGTDHGHLPLWLLTQNRLTCAIASDLREGPLDHARDNARFHGLTDRVSFRLASGLEGIATPSRLQAWAVKPLLRFWRPHRGRQTGSIPCSYSP